MPAFFVSLCLCGSTTAVTGFRPDLYISARNLDTKPVETLTTRGVVTQVILLGKASPDLVEYGRDGLLIGHIQSTPAAHIRERLQRMRVDQDRRTDRDEIQQHA